MGTRLTTGLGLLCFGCPIGRLSRNLRTTSSFYWRRGAGPWPADWTLMSSLVPRRAKSVEPSLDAADTVSATTAAHKVSDIGDGPPRPGYAEAYL